MNQKTLLALAKKHGTPLFVVDHDELRWLEAPHWADLDWLDGDVPLIAELAARVNRHLRTQQPTTGPSRRFLDHRDVRLDLDRRMLLTPDGPTMLSERETSVLAHLLRRRGDVCTRDELLHDVWGYDFDPGSNVLEVCVGRLRAKLAGRAVIETVRGVGYYVNDI